MEKVYTFSGLKMLELSDRGDIGSACATPRAGVHTSDEAKRIGVDHPMVETLGE
jgi:hypothetical protein